VVKTKIIMANKTVKKVARKMATKVDNTVKPKKPKPVPCIAHATPTNFQEQIQGIIDNIAEKRVETKERNIALTNLRKSIVWLNR